MLLPQIVFVVAVAAAQPTDNDAMRHRVINEYPKALKKLDDVYRNSKGTFSTLATPDGKVIVLHTEIAFSKGRIKAIWTTAAGQTATVYTAARSFHVGGKPGERLELLEIGGPDVQTEFKKAAIGRAAPAPFCVTAAGLFDLQDLFDQSRGRILAVRPDSLNPRWIVIHFDVALSEPFEHANGVVVVDPDNQWVPMAIEVACHAKGKLPAVKFLEFEYGGTLHDVPAIKRVRSQTVRPGKPPSHLIFEISQFGLTPDDEDFSLQAFGVAEPPE